MTTDKNAAVAKFIVEDERLYFVDELTPEMAPFNIEKIKRDLAASSFAGVTFDQAQLERDITQVNEQLELLKNQDESESEFDIETEVKFELSKLIYAKLEITVSDDKMEGFAKVTTAQGGAILDEEKIKQTCRQAGIKFGLKAQLVEELLEESLALEAGSELEKLIVVGRPPEKGKDSFIEPKVTLFSNLVRNHKRFDDGRFDLRDLGEIETVEIGQVVAEKVAASSGIAGMNILGESVEPTPGEDKTLIPQDGTEINPENVNQLLATKQGLLRLLEGEVVVDDVLVLPKVDAKSGHVKFKGSVIVEGDVAPDMKIRASGDVTVGGFVESAIIECDGQIVISGGCSGRILNEDELVDDYAKARKARYSATLKSGQNINVAFTNQCHLDAKFDIEIEKNLIHSHVSARSIKVGAGDKPNGRILGSYFYLSQFLEAGVIGSESNVHVDIDMNRGYDAIMTKLALITKTLGKIGKKKDQLIVKRKEQLVSNQNLEIVDKQVAACKIQFENYFRQKAALETRKEEYLNSLYVQANTRLFTHVKFSFAKSALVSEEQKGASQVRLTEKGVSIEPA